MTTHPAASSEDKPTAKEANDANEKSGKTSAADAAAKKRESFLRRIEQQQQQQQQKSAPKEASDESKVNNTPSSPQETTADSNAKKKDDTTPSIEKKQQDDESTKSTEKKKETGLEEIREIARSGTDDQVIALAQALAKALAETKEKSDGVDDANAGISSSSSKPKSNVVTFHTRVPTKKKQSIGDQLLTDYLSKFCDGPNNHNDGACCPPNSSPADWIQDVDPSSLAVLKVMAGIKDATTTSTTTNNHAGNTSVASSSSQLDASSTTAVGRIRSDKADNPPPPGNNFHPGNNVNNHTVHQPPATTTTPAADEPTKMWEVQVPREAIPGEPFTLMAGGVRVRVLCPKNAGPGQRIRFHLPVSLFLQNAGKAEGAERVPPPPPPVPMPPPTREEDRRGRLGYGGSDSAANVDAAASGGPNDIAGDSGGNDDDHIGNDDPSLNRRMLAIIERQQTQMQEMQARLDALSGMMASMEQDVRYLRQRREERDGWRDIPVGGYRMFGGLFGGNGGDGEGGGNPAGGGGGQQGGGGLPQAVPRDETNMPQQPQQQPQRPVPRAIPHIPPEIPRAVARPVPDNVEGHQFQGIFYPLFVLLFTFLFSLPGRLRNLLLRTGPGRVYAHLREQARARRAFAHVDLASVVKLMVMLLIFAGRVGRDGGGGNGRRPNNNNNNNGGARNNNNNNNGARDNGGGDDDDASMIAHAWTLLRTVADYWNGHRVHALVLASMIAFLIQVGLMSFLYQVLWVERAELLRAFLGRDEAEDAGGDTDRGDAGGVDGGAPNGGGGGDDVGGNAGRRDPARRPVGRPEHAGNVADGNAGAAGAAPPPDVAIGGMIRRGPNNGGFFHDVQCLALSFVLSLIPAWRPEEAAQPAEEAARRAENAARAGRQEPPPPARVGGAGNDAGAAGDEIIVE